MTQQSVTSEKRIEHLQQILLSLIPATALLVIGAYSSQMVSAQNELLFCIVFLLGALLTFLGEKKILSLMQQARSMRYVELTEACNAFLAGNLGIKVPVHGHDGLTTLATSINLLLDRQRQLLQQKQSPPPQAPPPSAPSPSKPVPPAPPAPQNEEVELLKGQLMQIINELSPVTKGDLRVHMSIPGNLIGIVADACNSFIEELTQFVKWTRYASQVVTTASRSILDRSIEMAKNTEHQMRRLSTTTNHIEEIALFMQQLNNKLYLNLDITKEVQETIKAKMQPDELASTTFAGQLVNELQRQTEFLEGILHSAEETSAVTEPLIGDLYAVSQQIYQSSISTLNMVKRLSELEALAERWHKAAAAFTVFEGDEAEAAGEPWLL